MGEEDGGGGGEGSGLVLREVVVRRGGAKEEAFVDGGEVARGEGGGGYDGSLCVGGEKCIGETETQVGGGCLGGKEVPHCLCSGRCIREL